QNPHKIAIDNGGLWVADTSNDRVMYFSAVGGKPFGGNADLVLGQIDFNSIGSITGPGELHSPTGLAAFAGRVWIGDTGGRVVRHENAAAKGNGTEADGVLGRNSLETPWFGSSSHVAVEPFGGKLFVSDPSKNRVLRFASARSLQENSAPEAVLGQPDFTTTSGGTSSAKMDGPTALAADSLGNLWVVDSRNHRVLRFANAATAGNGAAASQVLGQAGFTTKTTGVSATTLNTPNGIAFEWGINGSFQIFIRRLWVADRNNHRVLRYENPIALGNGGAASGVLGAANLTSTGLQAVSASGLSFPGDLAVDLSGPNARLWVADVGHERVLRFDAAAAKANNGSADAVLLQSGFTSVNTTTGSPTAGLSLDAGGTLYLTRGDFFDIAWYKNAATKPSGSSPDGTLGDTGRIYASVGSTSRGVIDPFSGRLWVSNGSRVLRFTPTLESRISGYGFDNTNHFYLTISGKGGEIYQIRSSTDLENWDTIERTDTVPGTGTAGLSWISPTTPAGPRKFYRLQVP
ncbi:MAG: hypothetical protein KDN05_07570, partial [Verrucomicrobiae bacterium]|nr:hypothetical protein [Verrucomicrobiae bacterium]